MISSFFPKNLVGVPGENEIPTPSRSSPAQCPLGSWSGALALGPEEGLGWPR